MIKKIFPFLIIIVFSVVISPQGSKEESRLLKNLLKTAEYVELLNTLDITSEKYPGMKKKIIRSLRRSAKFSSDRDQKDYLLSFIPEFKKNNRLKYSGFPGVATGYELLLFTKRSGKKYFPVILKNDVGLTTSIEQLFSSVKELTEKGLMKRNVRFFPKKIFAAASVLKYPDTLNESILLYHYKNNNETQYPMMFFLTDKMKKIFQDEILPVAGRVTLKRENLKSDDAEAYILSVALHKFSHFLAPVVVKTDSDVGKKKESESLKTPRKVLKEYFHPIEEARAETDKINTLFLLSKEKYLTVEKSEEIIKASIFSGLLDLKNSGEKKPAQFSTLLFNSLFKDGALTVNLVNKRLKIDMTLLKESIKKMNDLLFDLEINGKFEESKEYIEKNSKISDQLKSLLKLL